MKTTSSIFLNGYCTSTDTIRFLEKHAHILKWNITTTVQRYMEFS